ncbi:MAG: acyl CoA:acetate/3-ketoacid CoA transferase [bacterium]|nr:acyl CoA:acetate/3-ketoacid CoA transferase [bacterium]
MPQYLTAEEAVALIPDGASVLVNPLPIEKVFGAFPRVFEETGHPANLTLIWGAGIGPFSDEPRGMNHFAVPGMLKRVVAGHVGLNYRLVKMIATDQLEAYNLPQGTMTQLLRDVAAKRPGLLTRVGVGTFVDPRIDGGKLNQRTAECEDLVELVELDGREYLRYKPFHVDVGIVRGTAVDPNGNITADDEALTMENLEVAIAAKAAGGFVIAQVAETLDSPAHPHHVEVPGMLIDYVVMAERGNPEHPHTLFVEHDPALSGNCLLPVEELVTALPLGLEKVICRRAAKELRPGQVVNLGVGIPMGVAAVASEVGALNQITLTTELGVIGGLPEGGLNFGPAKCPQAFISQPSMFDFYDGGGLDITCVGAAQIDRHGNVNVSKIGPKVIGCGGFINITQSARNCVFCGEFTAGGLDAAVVDGRIEIRREGKIKKFVSEVEHITFAGQVAREDGRKALFVTERCVFELVPEGLLLKEVAPGVDVEKDVIGQMDFTPIMPDDVPEMDPAIFQEEPIGLCDLMETVTA